MYEPDTTNDKVLVTDRAGRTATAMATSAVVPGQPISIYPVSGLSLDYSRPLRFDPTGAPSSWRLPGTDVGTARLSAQPTTRRAPQEYDVVATRYQDRPARGIGQAVERPGETESPVHLSVYTETGTVVDSRRATYHPDAATVQVGQWAWPPAA
jgi:hypothetical protein